MKRCEEKVKMTRMCFRASGILDLDFRRSSMEVWAKSISKSKIHKSTYLHVNIPPPVDKYVFSEK